MSFNPVVISKSFFISKSFLRPPKIKQSLAHFWFSQRFYPAKFGDRLAAYFAPRA
jgi:hypothetical protein